MAGGAFQTAVWRGSSISEADSPQRVAQFVGDEIAEAFAAVARVAHQPGVNEIGQQDAVAALDLRTDAIGRMPRVGSDSKGVAGIRRKTHLLCFLQRAVGKLPVKDGAEIRA